MSDFSNLSPEYQHRAVLQQSASEKLFELLAIQPSDDVLDLGCGPGHLTKRIRELTNKTVVGVDPAEGMIAQSRQNVSDPSISFYVCDAESLDFANTFDVIFCNSVFQWFRNPEHALRNCFRAVRAHGRMGVQAPARTEYCPNFIRATTALLADPRTRPTFARFRSPWFFLETPEAYAGLFEASGFAVSSCRIEEVTEYCSPSKAFEMFESGASAGYLNPDCYDILLPPGFIKNAREVILGSFYSQMRGDGTVAITFYRVYVLAHKVAEAG